MNGNAKHTVSKVLMIIIVVSIGISFSSELNLIVKVKKEFAKDKNNITILATGSSLWDLLNKEYCCSEIKQLSYDLKNNDNARKLGLNRIYTLKLNCVNEDTAFVLDKYMNIGCFEFVEVNDVLKSTSAMSSEPFFPNDPYWVCQWPLHNTGIDLDDTVKVNADINMPEAWGVEQGDSSVIIAILDSGIKNWHNEFDGRIWINENEIPDNGIDDDSNGYIDDNNGWNFVDGNNIIEDKEGHGTAIASIIGSNINNSQGISGINGKSKLMILKIIDSSGNAYLNNVATAINYAVNYGAKLINLSLAGPNYSQVAYEFVNFANEHNVIICAGSGNKNVDTVYYPAKLAHVIAVGATTRNDKRCTAWMGNSLKGGSNYGDSLDVVAPGDSISGMNYYNGSYPRNGGTSYSTAFVTGIASLLISQDTSCTPDEIYRLITSTADDQVGDPAEDTPGYDKYYGYGRINAYKALLVGQSTKLNKKNKQANHSIQLVNIQFEKNSNLLNVKLVNDKNESTAAFRLSTIQGRIIHTVNKTVRSNELTILLPSLSKGIYCYSIDLNGNKYSGKLMF